METGWNYWLTFIPQEWLLRHIHCPFCRVRMLPPDEVQGEHRIPQIKKLMGTHRRRNATSFYCFEEGLVNVPAIIECTPKERKAMQSRILDGLVKPGELAELRGLRIPGEEDEQDSTIFGSSQFQDNSDRDVIDGVGEGELPGDLTKQEILDEVDTSQESEGTPDEMESEPAKVKLSPGQFMV